VTLWEVSRKACEWEQSTLKRLVLVCGVSRQYLNVTSGIRVWFRSRDLWVMNLVVDFY